MPASETQRLSAAVHSRRWPIRACTASLTRESLLGKMGADSIRLLISLLSLHCTFAVRSSAQCPFGSPCKPKLRLMHQNCLHCLWRFLSSCKATSRSCAFAFPLLAAMQSGPSPPQAPVSMPRIWRAPPGSAPAATARAMEWSGHGRPRAL
jgi:hypothetical protein